MSRMIRRALAAVTALVVLSAVTTGCGAAGTYSWSNVVVKGGGFVPGIIFNRAEKDLIYARTDIGGAYRWDQAAGRWIPLLDWVGADDWGLTGVVSLATDALDPDRVYIAGGTYTNDWDPKPGAILRSADRGATWEITRLPFKLGGNMPGRGMGERLQIDPNDNRILYLGAPSGNGLWRSTDQGVTWGKVASFPNPGNYVDTPGNPYGGDIQGVTWVTFDERTGTRGSATRTIYVGVADKDNTVYRSTDGGANWARIPGQPTGYLAHKGVLDADGSFLYLATSDNGGPYGGDKGEVWKLSTATGEWTQITPPLNGDNNTSQYGYNGLTVDRQHPGTVMATRYSAWWPDTQIFRSTDHGATWKPIWQWAGYPARTLGYELDASAAPWLGHLADDNQPAPPEERRPKLGWMTESMEIDPFNPDRLLFGTGATIFGTTNLTAWDTGGKVKFKPVVEGFEETAVLDLVSPPSGAPLLSALGDIGGFRHDRLDTAPAKPFNTPYITSTTSIDFAEQRPGFVVRVGNQDGGKHIGISSDGGANWWAGGEPAGVNKGGMVAVNADGSRIVWAPDGIAPVASGGDANTWQPAAGLPTLSQVRADRVDPNVFYGFNGGTFYRSTDGGRTFARTAAPGLPSGGKIKAVPGVKGDVWLAGGTGGLFHSTDGGDSFAKVENVDEAATIGFGKAAPDQTYPALYASARAYGSRGIFRSDDGGTTWLRINDDQHQFGSTNDAITGDPRVYGRVYVSTNGRGIIVGDKTG